MREFAARLAEAVRERSTGRSGQRLTYGFQSLSAAVFFALGLGCWERSTPLALLFLLEAAGQVLLAADERDAATQGVHEVVYFRRTTSGRAAAVVFALVNMTRLVMLDALLGGGHPITAVGGLAALGVAALARSTKVRPDLVTGTGIATVAALLGVTLLYTGHPIAGACQLGYAALLTVGVLALRPWQAELANIPIFAAAAWFPPIGVGP